MPDSCCTVSISSLVFPLTSDFVVFPSWFPSLSSWHHHSHHHIITLFSRSGDLWVPTVSRLPSWSLGYVDSFVTLYSIVQETGNWYIGSYDFTVSSLDFDIL